MQGIPKNPRETKDDWLETTAETIICLNFTYEVSCNTTVRVRIFQECKNDWVQSTTEMIVLITRGNNIGLVKAENNLF